MGPFFSKMASPRGLARASMRSALWATLRVPPVRIVQGCTGAAKHWEARERPPGELVEPEPRNG